MTQTISQTKNLTAVRNDGLEHAFDFDLQAAPGREPFVSTKNREGAFIVNGVGTVNGEMIHGKIKMSFFAIDCAYLLVQAGVDPRPGQHLCKENDGGVIETEDGAQITFDTKAMGCGEPTLRFPSAGDWQWRSSFPLRTSATTGSTKPSGSGKVSSTKREAQLATKATYGDTTNLASKYVAFPLFCYSFSSGETFLRRHKFGVYDLQAPGHS